MHNAYVLAIKSLKDDTIISTAKVQVIANVFFTESYYEKVAIFNGDNKNSLT